MVRGRQGKGSRLHPIVQLSLNSGFLSVILFLLLYTSFFKQSHLYSDWFDFFTRNLVHSVKTIHLVHNHCMRKRKSLHHILTKDLKPFYNYELMGRQWAWDWVWSSWVEYALVIINPPTSAIFKLSLSFHLHPVLILCCVFHPVIQLKFHCCTPAASLISVPKPSQCRKPVYICTHTQKVLLTLEVLKWNMSVKRLLETTYTMPKNLFCNYVNEISQSGLGQVYAGFLGCQIWKHYQKAQLKLNTYKHFLYMKEMHIFCSFVFGKSELLLRGLKRKSLPWVNNSV